MSESTLAAADAPKALCAPRPRYLSALTIVGFVVTAVIVQALHPVYDWHAAPLSFYLSGPHGPWLQAAYVGLALGLALLLPRPLTGEGAAGCLHGARWALVLGGAALIVTAVFPGGSPDAPVAPALHRLHGLAALSTFVLIGLGMLLAGLARWQQSRRGWLLVALLVVGALLLDRLGGLELPRGLSQKLVIGTYLTWLLAWSLWPHAATSCVAEASPDGTGRAGGARLLGRRRPGDLAAPPAMSRQP